MNFPQLHSGQWIQNTRFLEMYQFFNICLAPYWIQMLLQNCFWSFQQPGLFPLLFSSQATTQTHKHIPSPICDCCGVLETRVYLLLDYQHWSYIWQHFHQQLIEQNIPIRRDHSIPTWTWAFFVQSMAYQHWLGHFLVAIRPRWRTSDQLHSDTIACSSNED